jgi:hypothetical protein
MQNTDVLHDLVGTAVYVSLKLIYACNNLLFCSYVHSNITVHVCIFKVKYCDSLRLLNNLVYKVNRISIYNTHKSSSAW